jgi:flagellar protein FlbD
VNFLTAAAEKILMIRLTRLNQVPLVLNSDLIEHIEMTPDTVISLTSGQKFMVRETSEQVIERIINFRRAVLNGMPAYNWPMRNSEPNSVETARHSERSERSS